MKRIILLTFFVLYLPIMANADVYYIDSKTGSDSNPGTSSEPFKTWKKTLSSLQKNDTVVFPSYDEPSYEQANRIIMKQKDVERANHWVDKGTWKQRLEYIEMKSRHAGLKTMLRFNYEINVENKTINTLNTEKIIEKY